MPNLIWKEWHEQRWKLGLSCIVLSALALIGLHSRILADETMVMWVCFVGMTLLPVLSSTGLVPAERSEGCFESLLSLPIAPWRILAAKTAMGLILCAGPLAVAALVSLLVAGEREMPDGDMLALYGRSTLAALSLFVWMLALTIRMPNEARAGLLAMGVLIFWAMATAALAGGAFLPLEFVVSPLAFVYEFSPMFYRSPQFPTVLAVQVVIAAMLWACTLTRLTGAVEGQS